MAGTAEDRKIIAYFSQIMQKNLHNYQKVIIFVMSLKQ